MAELSEFTEEFHEEIHSDSIVQEIQKEEAFVSIMGGILSECGDSDTVINSTYISTDEKTQVDGYSYDDDEGTLCLIKTIWLNKTDLGNCKLKDGDILEAIDKASNFLKKSIEERFAEKIEISTEAHYLANLIFKKKGKLKKVKIIVITDGIATKKPYDHIEENGIDISRIVWDLERTHYYYENGREEINVDFTDYLNAPLKCTKEEFKEGGYTTYLGFIPGIILAHLYEKWEMKLLDLNVRVFLQRRGKVNKGIHKTIKDHPEDFCSYNNGITVFAKEIKTDWNGTGIISAEGFQVVNGGQTTASLFWAKKERIEIEAIKVQMKLTVIHDENRKDELVAKMSEYSNTQNPVSPVDQHAKLYPHPQLQAYSRKLPAPADGAQLTFWFYERMRGSYAEQKRLEARTVSQKKHFDLKYPTSQKFDRLKFGKVWNAFNGRPEVVCEGGQKAFTPFNMWLTEYTSDGEIDLELFFKETVALLLIWNKVDSKELAKKKIDGEHLFPAHRNRIVAYSISWLFHLTNPSIDLEKIWNNQEVPKAIIDTLERMLPIVDEHIRKTNLDVGEYCKKKDCWEKLKEREFDLGVEIQEECYKGKKQTPKTQIMPDEKAIEFCKEKGPDAWWKLFFYARDNRLFTKTAISQCANMGKTLSRGNDPSPQLSLPCMQTWVTAEEMHEWKYENNQNN